MARSIDLDHLLLLLVIAQQVPQLGLGFMSFLILQPQQSPQLAHFDAVGRPLHRHDALDLLDQAHRLPPRPPLLQELGSLDWRGHGIHHHHGIVHDGPADRRKGRLALRLDLFGPPHLLTFLGLVRTLLLLDALELFVQLADERPVLRVGHLCDLKHLIGKILTSKEMLRISWAESPSCRRRRLVR